MVILPCFSPRLPLWLSFGLFWVWVPEGMTEAGGQPMENRILSFGCSSKRSKTVAGGGIPAEVGCCGCLPGVLQGNARVHSQARAGQNGKQPPFDGAGRSSSRIMQGYNFNVRRSWAQGTSWPGSGPSGTAILLFWCPRMVFLAVQGWLPPRQNSERRCLKTQSQLGQVWFATGRPRLHPQESAPLTSRPRKCCVPPAQAAPLWTGNCSAPRPPPRRTFPQLLLQVQTKGWCGWSGLLVVVGGGSGVPIKIYNWTELLKR